MKYKIIWYLEMTNIYTKKSYIFSTCFILNNHDKTIFYVELL